MSDYSSSDCQSQFSAAVTGINNYRKAQIEPSDDAQILFQQIYFFNVLLSRTELKRFFEQQYISSFKTLLMNVFVNFVDSNFVACSLELRALLDEQMSILCAHYKIPITRSFTNNKNSLDKKIKEQGLNTERFTKKIANIQTLYSDISGIIHQFDGTGFFNQEFLNTILSTKNPRQIKKQTQKCFSILIYFNIFLTQDSLKLWDHEDLFKVLNLVYGANKAQETIKLISTQAF